MTDLAAARFDLIAPLLRRYKRRFTVLDLGAGINPYMAQRISREFDAVVVAIEQDEIAPEELAKFGPRALWLRKKMSVEDLRRLGECEHFDVVLALNFLHHQKTTEDAWRALVELIQMAAFVVIQTPHMNDFDSCGGALIPTIHITLDRYKREGVADYLGESVQFYGHSPRPLYCVHGLANGELTSSSWTSPPACIKAFIYSDFTGKTIEIKNDDGMKPLRPFIHGLNLWNFAQLNGQWPRKEQVLKLIHEFPLRQERHGDITPHNFLFDGAELHLIDGYEGWEFDDKENLAKTERMMADVLQ